MFKKLIPFVFVLFLAACAGTPSSTPDSHKGNTQKECCKKKECCKMKDEQCKKDCDKAGKTCKKTATNLCVKCDKAVRKDPSAPICYACKKTTAEMRMKARQK